MIVNWENYDFRCEKWCNCGKRQKFVKSDKKKSITSKIIIC